MTKSRTAAFQTPRSLYTEEQIAERVSELARRISDDYAGSGDLWMVGVLKGAFIFLADLARRLTIPRHVDFMSVASYGNGAESGAVRLVLDLRENIEGKHVLIVEDILDTGHTLAYLQDMLRARRPASLRTCAFLRKRKARDVEPPVDYVGFDIDDEWVVGYGLDYADMFRTLPYIGIIEPPEDRRRA
jgi:hypoxanthine phosphoribosyltransferase